MHCVTGWPDSVYKCVSLSDGYAYVIRKVEGFRFSNEETYQNALKVASSWKQFYHPNVVSFREMFISKDFGDANCNWNLYWIFFFCFDEVNCFAFFKKAYSLHMTFSRAVKRWRQNI